MSIVDSVRQAAEALDPGARVARTVIGGIYAAVQLDSGEAGVAYRFPPGPGCHRGVDSRASEAGFPESGVPQEDSTELGTWIGKPVGELVGLLGAGDLVESALALASINAICQVAAGAAGAAAGLPGDVLDHLELRRGDRLCMVGCFLPVLEHLRGRGVEVTSVDERPRPGALPAEEAESLLPDSQVALITATALVNGTLEHLLALSQGCRTVALLGPSTPMLPQAFSATPVRLLSGIRILEPDPVLEIVAAAGGFRDFRPHVVKVNLRV